MDHIANPYTPGAGSRPRELAGRDAEIAQFDTLLGRLERGNPERSMIVSGLRGVGKTVLLNEFERRADARKWGYASLEARTSDLDVRDEIARMAQNALVEISVKHKAKESLRKVARLLKAFTFTANESGELEGSFDLAAAFDGPTGNLERDLVRLFQELGEAAADHETGAVFFIDEMQLLGK
jgi:AAA+ ATPase superfamily predicted ATPase